ncbi:hypothetical protein EN742_01670 [Mesorhizobium sp. M4A.F.Ca.ET.020.02.1.1]|uniref:hypothetical protein n=1 Tax=Mesorhizobium sp. M4A.F.Ca.ET.020.02.1.1 TaxID=2496652 RepID=UPI000FD3EA89|nr:hypothetical protein [Mesorhizobium sp. M4A.F.Ca.ET.020.02.1.1]RVD44650.1 hypothetical protein EN742_01670 [Mesorhizobium sp. M4A.F.Ca.ET.020.02.1.1]TIW78975.1 MAG: hypothetical protein E5V53_20805 [Mesorhizobium sp.]
MTYPVERMGKCHRHGETTFRRAGKQANGSPMYKCPMCKNARARAYNKRNPQAGKKTNARRLAKRVQIVALFGGECIRCGYSKSTAALHFHHRDGAMKSFQIACREMWRPHADIVAEASKCDLICANCHCELHFADGTMGPKKRLNALSETHQERNT